MRLRRQSRRKQIKRKVTKIAGKRVAARLKKPALVIAGAATAIGGALAARKRKSGTTPA